MPTLKIAIAGTRGIPANYGGFETFAQELSVRLVQAGHRVTVYCRSHYFDHKEKHFQGVQLVVLPAIRHKYLDTVTHGFISMVHAMFSDYDIVLVCNSANSPFCLMPRLGGKRVLINVDGLEWKRRKWNRLGRWYYLFSERLATMFPHRIVTDALAIQKYYQLRYGQDSEMIPYGADPAKTTAGKTLGNLGLVPGSYLLYVSRLEPENNADLVIRIFEKLKTDKTLLIVGDAPYSQEYIQDLKRTRDKRIVFTGAIYGDGYRELISNPFCYIHATEVGGTHPALIENMAQGNLILYLDTEENREVVGATALAFSDDGEESVSQFQSVLDHPHHFDNLRRLTAERARNMYSWENIVAAYLRIFHSLLKK